MPRTHFAGLALLLTALAPSLTGQWSTDAAANLAVGDSASDQNQAKLEPTDDGGVWVSWFDGIGSGYDVRVQKLDIGGAEVLAHNGVLVADRSFSSTQDYGLDTDVDGNALLAYRDDQGVGTQIGVNKVLPDGSMPWGAAGVQVTSTGTFVASPKVAGTSDGLIVVAWTEGSSVKVQSLDGSGGTMGSTLTFTPGVGSFSVSDMHDTGDDVILSFVHQTGAFGSPRRLRAHKIDASTGALVWGAAPVEIFNAGSLQFGNFPSFTPDGTGGAVFSWYDTGSFALQCYVQRLASDGTAAFPVGGVACSTNAVRIRVSPSAAYDESTGETTAFWVEQNSGQSQSGVYGQRFDASGTRLWTDDGLSVVGLSGDSITQVNHLTNDAGSLIVWNRAPGFGFDVLLSALVSPAGAVVQAGQDVASTASAKSRLAMARTASGTAALAWKDERTDGGDIYSQNVNEDGTLGPRWNDLGGAISGGNGTPVLTGMGPLTAGSFVGLDLQDGPSSDFALLWISLSSTPLNFFSGTVHALPFTSQITLFTSPSGGVAGGTTFPPGFPPATSLWFQFVLQDPSVFWGITLSNALRAETP